MMLAVALMAVVMAYIGSYYRWSRRGMIEAKRFMLNPEFLHVRTAKTVNPDGLSPHRRLSFIYAPLNWVDRTLFGIGNNTNVDPIDHQVNPDWTFSANGNYQVQNLEVLVHPLAPAVPDPSTMAVAVVSCLVGIGGPLACKRRQRIWPR
jgi:hypothetical protein